MSYIVLSNYLLTIKTGYEYISYIVLLAITAANEHKLHCFC
jgi:hypothetical protein